MTNFEGDIKLAATLVGFSLNSHGFQRNHPRYQDDTTVWAK